MNCRRITVQVLLFVFNPGELEFVRSVNIELSSCPEIPSLLV